MYLQKPQLEQSAVQNLLDISDDLNQTQFTKATTFRAKEIHKRQIKTNVKILSKTIMAADRLTQTRQRNNSQDHRVNYAMPKSTITLRPYLSILNSQNLKTSYNPLIKMNYTSMNEINDPYQNSQLNLLAEQKQFKRKVVGCRNRMISANLSQIIQTLSGVQIQEQIEKKIMTYKDIKTIFPSPERDNKQTFLPQSYLRRVIKSDYILSKQPSDYNMFYFQKLTSSQKKQTYLDHLNQVRRFQLPKEHK